MYKLTSENMVNAGLAMGLAHTTTNYIKYFKSVEAAKRYAEKEYRNDRPRKIEWSKDGRNKWTSGDLLFVMYDIEKVETED